MCDVKEAQKRGYIEAIPHFTMPSKYMRKEELTPILHQLITASALPLKAVESSFCNRQFWVLPLKVLSLV